MVKVSDALNQVKGDGRSGTTRVMDMESVGLKVEDFMDRTRWREKSKTITATPDDRKSQRRRSNTMRE